MSFDENYYRELPPLPWATDAGDIEAWMEVRSGSEITKEFQDYARAAIAASTPKSAMTDEQIAELGRNLQCFKNKAFRESHASRLTGPEQGEYNAVIAFARVIEAASAPNAAMVEALQYAVDNSEFDSEKFDGMARAALAAAGIKP